MSVKVLSISDRLNRIQNIIVNNPFKGNKALNNGNGGYIFDYDPEDELVVRAHVKRMSELPGLEFEIVVIDLFDVFISFLKNEGYLEEAYQIEEDCRQSGNINDFIYAMDGILQQGTDDDIFVNYLCNTVHERSVVFLTGVGKCHPFIRAHQIINNYDSMKRGVKTILFYPGVYDSEELKLFGTVPSENYYRASILIPRRE